jgi:hypothetical protein
MNGAVPTLSHMRVWRVQLLLIYTLDNPQSKSLQTSYTDWPGFMSIGPFDTNTVLRDETYRWSYRAVCFLNHT